MNVALEPRAANIRFGAAVYGSFLVASVVGVAFEAREDARAMTATAAGSMLVFWLAHWWSEVVGAHISSGEPLRGRDALVIARREWPLVEASVIPTLLLGLAWLGVWSRETGAVLALAAAIAQIAVWGFVAVCRAAAVCRYFRSSADCTRGRRPASAPLRHGIPSHSGT